MRRTGSSVRERGRDEEGCEASEASDERSVSQRPVPAADVFTSLISASGDCPKE